MGMEELHIGMVKRRHDALGIKNDSGVGVKVDRGFGLCGPLASLTSNAG